MKKIVLITISMFLSANVFANPIFDKLEGEWAAEDWYNTLLKTKSEKAAASANYNYMSHLIFKRNDKAYNIDIVLSSFHEATGDLPFNEIRRIEEKGVAKYELIYGRFNDENSVNTVVAKIQFINDKNIVLTSDLMSGSGKTYTEKFIKVHPSIKEFTRNVTSKKDNKPIRYELHSNMNDGFKTLTWEYILKKIDKTIDYKEYITSNYRNEKMCGYTIIGDDIKEAVFLLNTKNRKSQVIRFTIDETENGEEIGGSVDSIFLKGYLNWEFGPPQINLYEIGRRKVLEISEGGNATINQYISFSIDGPITQLQVKDGYFKDKYEFKIVGRASLGEYTRITGDRLKLATLQAKDNKWIVKLGGYKVEHIYFVEDTYRDIVLGINETKKRDATLEKFFNCKMEDIFK